MATSIEKLVANVEEPIRTALTMYFYYVDSIMYDKEPNYRYCRNLFKDIARDFSGELLKHTPPRTRSVTNNFLTS